MNENIENERYSFFWAICVVHKRWTNEIKKSNVPSAHLFSSVYIHFLPEDHHSLPLNFVLSAALFRPYQPALRYRTPVYFIYNNYLTPVGLTYITDTDKFTCTMLWTIYHKHPCWNVVCLRQGQRIFRTPPPNQTFVKLCTLI